MTTRYRFISSEEAVGRAVSKVTRASPQPSTQKKSSSLQVRFADVADLARRKIFCLVLPRQRKSRSSCLLASGGMIKRRSGSA